MISDISDALVEWRPDVEEFVVLTKADWEMVKSAIPEPVMLAFHNHGMEIMPLVLDEGW